ncbi:MAG TPA: hypothetical protein VFJ43_07785 [Bacteroidia bacterium]|nr:hypothetical protein [Bacteroidia bacterium]
MTTKRKNQGKSNLEVSVGKAKLKTNNITERALIKIVFGVLAAIIIVWVIKNFHYSSTTSPDGTTNTDLTIKKRNP